MVSVAFFNKYKRTVVTDIYSLSDTGSPISCIKKSIIPFLPKKLEIWRHTAEWLTIN